jgi:hypothetical protein
MDVSVIMENFRITMENKKEKESKTKTM